MGGGDGTSYYANSVFLGGGTALFAVIAILVHLAVWGITPAMADLVALGAGVAGLLAGKQQVRAPAAPEPGMSPLPPPPPARGRRWRGRPGGTPFGSRGG
eukprot:COSAG06_NODE_40039_length_406_cov_0.788274_1_plen_99_part_10